MIRYKNITEKLSNAGWNSTRMKETGYLSQSTWTNIVRGKDISTSTIDKICSLLKCQPGDILEWVPDEKTR